MFVTYLYNLFDNSNTLCFLYKAPLRLRSCAYSVIPPPLDSEEKRMLDRFLRVDHAGEYGANRIYAGQMAVLGRSKTGPLIQVHPCLVSSATAFFFNLCVSSLYCHQCYLYCL